MATILKCKYCGTTTAKSGKVFANQGALNIHESVHCPKRDGGGGPAGGKQGKQSLQDKKCCDKPSYRFLASGGREGYARQLGYTKVCDNCEEVI